MAAPHTSSSGARVLVLGGGGREHALAWRLAEDPEVSAVLVAPGNGGTDGAGKIRNLPLDPLDGGAVAAWARREGPDLVVVGPEAPLLAGVADALADAGVRVLGPSRAAALLEGSKRHAKAFLERHGIPTASARHYDDPVRLARDLDRFEYPLVLKASGLAAGKGVAIVRNPAEARESLAALARLDGARDGILAETYLTGEELSYFVLAHGTRHLPLPAARDHKRLEDGDQGPNTGGMGAYSPPPLDKALSARIEETIVRPTLEGLASEGTPYVGFLYAGLMIDREGRPYVLEYNCRLGDPEAEVVLPRLGGSAFALFHAAAEGRLPTSASVRPEATVGVVVAAPRYPEAGDHGGAIGGLERAAEDALVFHAGTRRTEAGVVTNGGRLLCLVGRGPGLREARARAYAAVERLTLPAGARFRRDIALAS
jgi:phosphoribosylamine--glycine ligase